jgi:outer membrane biosynthesis protein TonB
VIGPIASAMVLELAIILLGACVGAIAVLYAGARGYLGRSKKATTTPAPSIPTIDTYATKTEQAPEVPAAEAPAVAEPAPSPAPEPTPTVEPTPAPEATPAPAPAIYETVQPAPAPVTFAAPTASSFAAPTLTKPTRTYRRRTAPVRSAAGSRKALAKPKKR